MRALKAQIGIYALADPTTDRVMYVGQSIDIEFRYRQHLDNSGFDGNLRKTRWLNNLRRDDQEPLLSVLETFEDWRDLNEAEKKWIRLYKSTGEAELNITSGGASRAASKILNGHPDDWYQFAVKQREAKRLLLELSSMAGEICDTKSSDFWRVIEQKIQLEIYRMETRLREVFPEWDDVYVQLKQEERDSERLCRK